jgi:hypothetical protein
MMLGGSALAQTAALPASPDPAVGGQASTKTPAGVGNPTQRPDGSNPASREEVKSEARAANKNTANTNLPKVSVRRSHLEFALGAKDARVH